MVTTERLEWTELAAGALACPCFLRESSGPIVPWEIARDAAAIADALMAERKKRFGGAHKLRDPKFYTARTRRAVSSGGMR